MDRMNTDNKISYYIIDRKKRQEYLVILFVFITISFGAGYAFGYLHWTPTEAGGSQKTAPSITSMSPSSHVTKPENKSTNNSLNEIEKQLSNKQLAKTSKINSSSIQTAKPAKSKPPVPISKKKSTPQKVIMESKTTGAKSAPQIEIFKTKSTLTTEPIKKIKESAKSTDNNPAKYLVQVGLFASRKNASAFIEQLEESGFEGYFEGFISTSGVEKYNVRLGPFTEKNTAQKKMSEFKKIHNSSAYILTKK